MATGKDQRSHRNLGPIRAWKEDIPLNRFAQFEHTQPGGEFHHFGGKHVERTGLGAKTLKNIYFLIHENIARSEANSPLLNKPEETSPRKSQGIPAGYTYLFQLAAHDVVHTSIAAQPYSGQRSRPRNQRRRPLELETVLGGGPISCPIAYDLAKPGVPKLRLGHVREDNSYPPFWLLPARDLPRISFAADGNPNPNDGLDTVLVADDRNDDNMLLAQLTVFFMASTII